MRISKNFIGFASLLLVACQSAPEPEEPPVFELEPYRQDTVALQNLQTRVLVYCYDDPYTTAQECAQEFERKGFVRLTDIPRLPAEYDFLTQGTYPTRRWRNNEAVSRW